MTFFHHPPHAGNVPYPHRRGQLADFSFRRSSNLQMTLP
jgi:hypothetical protein